MTDRDRSRLAIPAEMASESWAQSDHVRPLSAPPTRWTALLQGLSNDVQAGSTAGMRHAPSCAQRKLFILHDSPHPDGD